MHTYTVQEAAKILQVGESTVKDQITSGQLHAEKICNTYYINENELHSFQTTYYLKKRAISIPKHDLSTNAWLRDKKNQQKLIDWSQSHHIKWAEFSLEDYIHYWRYLIKHIWVQSEEYLSTHVCKPTKKPTNKWLSEHGFGAFVQSFKSGYLTPNNISTMAEFFETMEREQLW